MTNFKPRPTVYKGIQMRSRLEAGFAAWLDGWGVGWAYEPRAYASERGQYLPDFELSNVQVQRYYPDQPSKVFAEIKPTRPADELLLTLGEILWASESDAYLVAIWPGGPRWGLRLLTPPRRWGAAEMVTEIPAKAEDAVWLTSIPRLGTWPDGTPMMHNDAVHTIDVPTESPWKGEYWKPDGA